MLVNGYTNDKAKPEDPKIFIDVHADFPQAADRWEKLTNEKQLIVESVQFNSGTTRIVLGFHDFAKEREALASALEESVRNET